MNCNRVEGDPVKKRSKYPDSDQTHADIYTTESESIGEGNAQQDDLGATSRRKSPCTIQGQQQAQQQSEPSTIGPSVWQGWAELENDPTIFSTLLSEWGVQGIRVREVIPLDAIFDTPASSVYGLILLSRYVPAAPSAASERVKEPPPGLWFANQTSSFSCATVALMNIINNRLDADLGSRLSEFREFTKTLSSKARGHALDNFDHVKAVHNSFASEFDRMNVDLRLKEDAAAAARKKSKVSKKSKKNKKAVENADDDNGFHFVAYVPACGQIWRMDGMEAEPQSLGPVLENDSWIAKVIANLQSQWESATLNQLEFSLQSLVSGSDGASLDADRAKMRRAREDWGPFIANLIRMHAEKGNIRDSLI